jgi:hypothetical protein
MSPDFELTKAWVMHIHRGSVKRLRKSGIPLNAPQWAGGAGIPGSRDCPKILRMHIALCLRTKEAPPNNWRGTYRWNRYQRNILNEVQDAKTVKEGVHRSDAINTAVASLQRRRLFFLGQKTPCKDRAVEAIGQKTRKLWYEARKVLHAKKHQKLNPVSRRKLWRLDPNRIQTDKVSEKKIREILSLDIPQPRRADGKFLDLKVWEAFPLTHAARGSGKKYNRPVERKEFKKKTIRLQTLLQDVLEPWLRNREQTLKRQSSQGEGAAETKGTGGDQGKTQGVNH